MKHVTERKRNGWYKMGDHISPCHRDWASVLFFYKICILGNGEQGLQEDLQTADHCNCNSATAKLQLQLQQKITLLVHSCTLPSSTYMIYIHTYTYMYVYTSKRLYFVVSISSQFFAQPLHPMQAQGNTTTILFVHLPCSHSHHHQQPWYFPHHWRRSSVENEPTIYWSRQ